MKSDRSAAFPGAARRELFRRVEPEARRNMPAIRRDGQAKRSAATNQEAWLQTRTLRQA
jgi:hypothetical protein